VSALPRPDLRSGAHRDLVDALHDLHHRAGWPSLRALARETGVSHTTVSKTFSQPALPPWGTLELLVEAMGGDTTRFHALWLSASAPTDGVRHATRIAGRHAELAAVRRHLETGTGLLLVTGEAGIGKTTLAQTAAEHSDVVVARGSCLPLSTEIPLLPVADCLRSAYEADTPRFVRLVDACLPSSRRPCRRSCPSWPRRPATPCGPTIVSCSSVRSPRS
jgi:lambda repressor-like predicted transcriptional regulator